MRSRAESNCRFLAFQELLDTKGESIRTDIIYYGFLNKSCYAYAELDDPYLPDLYLRMESVLLDRYFGV